jgi:hypothetical protein
MEKLAHNATRRQLCRGIAAGAASPLLALTKKSEAQSSNTSSTAAAPRPHVGCLLKGTKISTPRRSIVRCRSCKLAMKFTGLPAVGYSKFTKEEGRVWRDSVIANSSGAFRYRLSFTSYRSLSLTPAATVQNFQGFRR